MASTEPARILREASRKKSSQDLLRASRHPSRFRSEEEIFYCGDWYLTSGRNLGYGERTLRELEVIAEALDIGQLYILVIEDDLSISPPISGVEAVAVRADLIVAPKQIMHVERDGGPIGFIEGRQVISADQAYFEITHVIPSRRDPDKVTID